jgi:hypothetical protein
MITGSRRLDSYLSRLPGGLDAHPACRAKGSLVRNLVDDVAAQLVLAELPAPLRSLAEDPPVETEWVPEVHFVALLLALADHRALTDLQTLAWVRERNRLMFASPLYRMLIAVASPASLLRIGAGRWANFHRGSTLEVEGIADDGVRVVLRYPPGLFDRLLLRIFAESFGVALELSRGRDPRVRLEEERPGFARYRGTWE